LVLLGPCSYRPQWLSNIHSGPPSAQWPLHPHSGFHFLFIFLNFLGAMKPARLRKSFLDLIQLRERAHRVLRRRINPLVHGYEGNDLRSALIEFCTENTFRDCILSSHIDFHQFNFLVAICSISGYFLVVLVGLLSCLRSASRFTCPFEKRFQYLFLSG